MTTENSLQGMAPHARPRGEKINSLFVPTNANERDFSPIPIPVDDFIPARNSSSLGNTINRGKFKLIISNQYKLNKQDSK
jgi:hypothetical protein